MRVFLQHCLLTNKENVKDLVSTQWFYKEKTQKM